MKLLLVFFTIIAVSGCSVAQRPISPEKLASIDKVGIISSIDSEICFSYLGFTVFGNSLDCEKVEDYPLSEKLVQHVYKSASEITEIPLNIINIDDETKALINNSKDSHGNLKVDGFSQHLSRNSELDGYQYALIFRPDVWQFYEAPNPIKGLGVWSNRKGRGNPYIIYQLELIDIKSNEVLAVGSTSYRDENKTVMLADSYAELDEKAKLALWAVFENAYVKAFHKGVAPLFYKPKVGQ
ncbi:hypothetical protein WNY63_03530 [Pseudoalteromonas neustonica]|uniref:Lipoprotein n=1 Tax=Pseudoalteromonas neustonica TaxID=1840331 RepID=A0ABU9TYF5_9GAMM